MPALQPHETPVPISEILPGLESARIKRAVVARAQYSPDPEKSERTLVFSERGNRLSKVADAWLGPETHEHMAAWLRERAITSLGSCDAMYSTSALHVWALREGALCLWRRGLLVGTFTETECRVRRGILGRWSHLSNAEIVSCHAYLSQSWVLRGVRLERPQGGSIQIAKRRELQALLDPTYDGLDLMGDTAWVVDLAKAISQTTAIPLKLHKDLC